MASSVSPLPLLTASLGNLCHYTALAIDTKRSLHDLSDAPSYQLDCSSQRTLRRKGHMSSLRARRSQTSLRQCTVVLPPQRQSFGTTITTPTNRNRPWSDTTGSGDGTNRPVLATNARAIQRPRSESIHTPFVTTTNIEHPAVKLGHPSRPYYTAIRKNMTSRLPTASPPPSTLGNDIEPPSPPLDVHRPALRQALSYPYTIPSSHPTYSFNSPTGFSLSGETELRMALSVTRKRENQSRRASLSLTLTRTWSGRSSKKTKHESENKLDMWSRRRAQTVAESSSEFSFVERPKGVKRGIQALGQGVRGLFS
ncbi:hypothetical protein NEOLEDRAFT_1174785 [Neolentinus lepideus HHB14362 ss-1]|uniref:Uncharacterized protein n=1 Tax=Neolentinus lepideus HHB14362 ss-1 TaxID=1314782 RepID=A0A165VJU9_9AGAM|nr:hypothetical protein NEOLEDRAFT_1174785 [Neolentinus lepideus HHB14362 ss-1]